MPLLRRVAVSASLLAVWLCAGAPAVSAAPGVLAAEPGVSVPATPGAPGGFVVNPSWGDAPGRDKVQQLLDFAAQAGLLCCLLAIVGGGAAMGIGKVVGSSAAGSRGMLAVLGGGAGALVIKFAPGIVSWLVG